MYDHITLDSNRFVEKVSIQLLFRLFSQFISKEKYFNLEVKQNEKYYRLYI